MSYLYETTYLTSALIKKKTETEREEKKDKQNKGTISSTNIEHEQNRT